MLLLLDCVAPLTRAAWRAQAAAIPFLVFFILQWSFGSNPPLSSLSPRSFYPALLGAAVAFAGVGTLWIWSLSNTTLAQSYLLSNVHGLLIVLLDLVLRQPVSWLEGIGTLVGFAGAGLTLLDDTGGSDSEASWKGSLAAFLSAVCLVAYFKCLRISTSQAPMLLVMMPVTFVNAFIASLVAVIGEGATIDADPCTGLFGWATDTWWWMALYLTLPVGAFGILGYTLALQVLPALLVSIFMLLEPIIGVAFGLIIGVNGPPGTWTYVGGAILLAGTAAVTYGAHKSSQKVISESTDATPLLDDAAINT